LEIFFDGMLPNSPLRHLLSIPVYLPFSLYAM
jgi:hypothetical protein